MTRTPVFGIAFAAVLLTGIWSLGIEMNAALPSATQAPPPSTSALGFGFGVQLDRPFQEVGSTGVATVFFFNMSRQDVYGVGPGPAGLFFLTVRDHKERAVWRSPPPPPWAAGGGEPCPIGPYPLPAGTFHRFDVPLPLEHWSSVTGDPDGEPLPGGLYTLEAVYRFNGPRPDPDLLLGPGADPEALVPFRIYRCSRETGPLPIRELAKGSTSGYRGGDPTFYGEDFVLRSEGAALSFWAEHTAHIVPPPPLPFVDFSREMVLVTLLGYQTSGGGPEISVRAVEEKACHVEVGVVNVTLPGPLDVITNPYHIVAVPRNMKEVAFVHAAVMP